MEITSKEKDCFFYMMMDDSTYFRLSLRDILEGMETTYTNVHGTVNLPEEHMIRIMQGPKVFLLGNQHVYCLDSVATDCPSIFPSDPDTSIHKISRLIHRKCSTENPPIVETLEGKIYVLATPPRPKPKFIAQNLKSMFHQHKHIHAETQRTSPLFFLVFDPSNNSWKHLSYPPHLKGSFRSFKVNCSKKPPFVERYCAWGHKLLVYGAGSASGTSYMYDTRLDKWVEFLDFEAMAFVEVHGFFIAVKRHPRRVVASRLDSNGIPGPEFKVLHQLDDIFCPFLRLDKCFMGRCGGDLLWIVHSSEYSHECYTIHVAIFQVSISLDHAGDLVLSAHLHAAGGYHLGGMACSRLSSAFNMLQYLSNDDISEKQLAVKSLRYHRHYHFEDSVPRRFKSGWIDFSSQDHCFSKPRLGSSSGISETSHSSGAPPMLEILPYKIHLVEEWLVPLRSVEDINEKFRQFCLRKLRTSPWHGSYELQVETQFTRKLLGSINTKGFLTINRKPAVNGERCGSPSVGWGYVYKKARLDFFCSKEKLDALVDKCKSLPSLKYIAMNREGSWISNIRQTDVNVVEWICYVSEKKTVEQTVVDSASFIVFKDEAFEIWSRRWANFYPELEGDSSRKLLEEVQNSYFLVSLVDEDYIHGGNLFAIF